MPYFFRFRSTEALLDKYHELENQEIYFCPPDDLNDPTEGFKDLFWRGDEIVWRSLLKHYLLCLMRSFLIAMCPGPDSGPVPTKAVVLGSRATLPTDELRVVHKNICDRFFAIAGMSDMITSLANFPYPLRRDGLAFCLRTAHVIGLNCVTEELAKARPALGSIGPPIQPVDAVNLIASVTTALKVLTKNEEGLDPAAFQTAFFVGDLLHRQVELINYSHADSEEARKWLSLIQGFPVTYIAQLDRLVYSDWWVACFVAYPTHAAMWGHYGDSHRGVCLKFKSFDTHDGQPAIKLQGITGGYGGPDGFGFNHGDRQLHFKEMQYVPKFVEVDFFRSIGVLPIPTLRDEWYSAEDGTLSSSADEIFTNEEQWRHHYWEVFSSISSTKFQDWQYEKEHRLLLTTAVGYFQKKDDRKLKYHFADLEGVIFGMNTSLEDKLKIINIIEAKCKAEGRKDFEFSQAVYDPATGTFAAHRLEALRFTDEPPNAS
jgi:hypothetical protein